MQVVPVLRACAAAALVLTASPSLAALAAVVEGVQMPAWVERAGRTEPLAAGMALEAGDRVRTGAGSRLLVKLSEGSLVKLGERAELRLPELAPPAPRPDGVFRLAMNVLQGAFRFTTDLAQKARRRDVRIQVASATVGIRGTDLWGRSREEREIVVLIEGSIEIAAAGEAPVTLDTPRQLYQRVRGVTQPLALVDPKQLAEWALETELEAGAGAARRGGRWAVALGAPATQAEALALYDRARAAGYAARIRPAGQPGAYEYRVRIGGLPSKAEAEALAARVRAALGIAGAAATGP